MRATEFLVEADISIDRDKAKTWIEKVYAKYPYTMQNNHVMVWGEGDDQQFAMFELTPSFSKRGAVEVKWIQAYPLRQGVGSKAMQELQSLAREDGISLTLFPWDKGQVSQSKLTKFYKGQGFKPTVKGSKNMQWDPSVNESKIVDYNGIQLDVSIDGANINIRPIDNGNQVGYVVFDRDGKDVTPIDLAIDEQYRGKGIAKKIYDYVKELGFNIRASSDQTKAGEKFWEKNRGTERVWEDEAVDEMALKQFTPMGDFNKPGPFKGVDKRLVPHPTNQIKTAQFFEKTPYDFRLFFSNIPGTGKYSETGPVTPQQLQTMFGEQAQPIIEGSEDAITVVFVGNSGDSKVMMTPWIMAHRFGHAIQAGARKNRGWSTWAEAEKHFFTSVNAMLAEYYGKTAPGGFGLSSPRNFDLTPEYNALFNAIGTQRSSRSGEIKRPYEFLYEIFAQYLGTGQVSFNPLPTNLGYGRKAWGTPSKYLNIKPEFRDESDRNQIADMLAGDMELMFNDVLSSSVGNIYVM